MMLCPLVASPIPSITVGVAEYVGNQFGCYRTGFDLLILVADA